MPPSSTSSSEPPSPADAPASEQRRGAWVSIAVCVATLLCGDLLLRSSPLGRSLYAESYYITRPRTYSADLLGADVLALGDSRIGCAFNPVALERVVNAERGGQLRAWNGALPGGPPMAQYGWVLRALAHHHPPRVVMLGISPYMFSSRIKRAPSREAMSTIFRIADIPAVLRAGASVEDGFTVLWSNLLVAERSRPRVQEVMTQFVGLRGAVTRPPQGYDEHGAVDAATQARNATARVNAYRDEIQRPAVSFGNEQQGYFVESLRALRDRGIITLVLDTPCATQMDAILGPDGIYPEHIAWVRAQTRAFGATFVDARHPSAIDNGDFADVDHTSSTGSVRFTTWLAHHHVVPALGGRRPDRPTACRTVFDFDRSLAGWTLDGSAMRDPIAQTARRDQAIVTGFTGRAFLSTFMDRTGDLETGSALSPPFAIDGRSMRLRVSGGAGNAVGIALIVDGAMVQIAHGRDSDAFSDMTWDVSPWTGRQASLRIFDEASGGWGHIQVDDVAICP